MVTQIRLLLGISIFWLALSILLDGINTLVLPLQVSKAFGNGTQATTLGLLTLIGLLAGALIQPVAGTLSDRWRPRLGRKGFIGIGLAFCLISILLFANSNNLIAMISGYLLIQISASIAQAGQQGLIPDLVSENKRGIASGLKGFMDLAGAMLGFAILGQFLGSDKTLMALGTIAAILVSVYLLAVLLTPEDRPNRELKPKRETISLSQLFRLDLTEHNAFERLLIARFLFLFGVYAIGRFLLLFVAARLRLDPNQAVALAGTLLAGLALVTILASPLTGWLADRIGRVPLMLVGAVLGSLGAFLLVWANSAGLIFLFGSLLSLGSAAFGSGSWALLADLVPKDESARFFGLANFSTAGPAAVVGLLGPAIDSVERVSPGNGYSILFIISALAFIASTLPLRRRLIKTGVQDGDKGKDRTHAAGLAVVHVPADPAAAEEDQDPSRRSAQL